MDKNIKDAYKIPMTYKGKILTKEDVRDYWGFVYLVHFPAEKYNAEKFPFGKFYIGRRKFHGYDNFNNYYGSGKYVKRYLKKHGRNGVRRKIIKIFKTKKEAREFEKQMTDFHNAVEDNWFMNLVDGGEGGASFLGEKNPFYGKTHTSETKEIIRQCQLGRVQSEETRQKRSQSMMGKKNSAGYKMKESTKEKLRKHFSGRKLPDWHVKKAAEGRQQPIVVNECIIFPARKYVAEFYKVSVRNTVKNWMNGKSKSYTKYGISSIRYATKEEKENMNSAVIFNTRLEKIND